MLANHVKILFFIHLFVLPYLLSCSTKSNVKSEKQQSYYSNIEGNNTIEGHHIHAVKSNNDTVFFSKNIQEILQDIDYNWCIGQGSGKPYYDSGKEQIWHIRKVLPINNAVIIYPSKLAIKLNQPLLFWKKAPLPNYLTKELKGSYGFSNIIYDTLNNQFCTHVHECDNEVVNIYSATSTDLLNWNITLSLTPEKFQSLSWVQTPKATPMPSNVVFFKGNYYHFLYGDDKEQYSRIGLMTSSKFYGPYKIHSQPLIEPNPESPFSNKDVYHPKVIFFKNSWWMFYTSKNYEKHEFVSVAKSSNLTNWQIIKENIVKRNKGWNSGLKNQMVAQVKINNDSLFLWVTGIKDVGHYDDLNKGNVMDQCIGKFVCTDTSFNFTELPGNPLFCGNPTSSEENDHIGAAFQEIFHNDYLFTFYHAKGRNNRKYTIFVK